MWIEYGGSFGFITWFGPCASYMLYPRGGTIQALGTDAPGRAGFLNISGNASGFKG